MSKQEPTEHARRLMRIGEKALAAAILGENEKAFDLAGRLSRIPDGLSVAMQVWCDTYANRLFGGSPLARNPHMVIQPGWIEDDGTIEDDPDRVDPAPRWAARVLAARVAMDKDAFRTLLSVPQTDYEITNYVMTLLESIADAINNPDGIVSNLRPSADTPPPEV